MFERTVKFMLRFVLLFVQFLSSIAMKTRVEFPTCVSFGLAVIVSFC